MGSFKGRIIKERQYHLSSTLPPLPSTRRNSCSSSFSTGDRATGTTSGGDGGEGGGSEGGVFCSS